MIIAATVGEVGSTVPRADGAGDAETGDADGNDEAAGAGDAGGADVAEGAGDEGGAGDAGGADEEGGAADGAASVAPHM